MSVNTSAKRALLAIACMIAIAGSATWIYFRQFKAPTFNVSLHQKIGEVMAEQTAKVAGAKGDIVLITIPTGKEPELAVQLEAFRKKLHLLGDYHIDDEEMDPKDQPKYGLGSGLSGRRFVRTVNKNLSAAAVVSFIGAPKLSDENVAELKKVPKFIAETRSPDHLEKLLDKKILRAAVVSRFVFPAPGPLQPRTAQEWFDKRYQVVAADAVLNIPSAE